MGDLVRWLYGRERPVDPFAWHRRSLWLPARTVEGRWATQVLRRMGPQGRWEYAARPEPEAEQMERQW